MLQGRSERHAPPARQTHAVDYGALISRSVRPEVMIRDTS